MDGRGPPDYFLLMESTTERRLDYITLSPAGYAAQRQIDQVVKQSGLPEALVELVKIRVSQMNGCAYCIDMHTRVARSRGESEQRLYALDAWRETPFFAEKERAALAWAEAVTFVADGHVPEDVYRAARAQFAEKELVDLTYAVVAINGWNRLSISFRSVPGSFQLPR